jgi:beta-ureidopropionase
MTLAETHNFDVQAFRFSADKEFLRQPRVVRVGLIQNSIAVPTTCHFSEQKKAIVDKIRPIVDAAGASGVNILCLQEAWTMPFAFCTREKRWCEFSEPVNGESTQFLQELAQKYNMVIVSPILERDVNHGETIWNTAVIIGNNGNIIGVHRKVCTSLYFSFSESAFSIPPFWQKALNKHYCRITSPELVISMRVHTTWRVTLGIQCLKQLMAK